MTRHRVPLRTPPLWPSTPGKPSLDVSVAWCLQSSLLGRWGVWEPGAAHLRSWSPKGWGGPSGLLAVCLSSRGELATQKGSQTTPGGVFGCQQLRGGATGTWWVGTGTQLGVPQGEGRGGEGGPRRPGGQGSCGPGFNLAAGSREKQLSAETGAFAWRGARSGGGAWQGQGRGAGRQKTR